MGRSWLTLVHAAPGSGKIRTHHRLSEHEGHLWLTKSTFSDRVGTKLYRRGLQIELGEKTQRRRMDLVWRAQLYQQWLKGGAGLRMRERTAQYDAYETRFIQGPCSESWRPGSFRARVSTSAVLPLSSFSLWHALQLPVICSRRLHRGDSSGSNTDKGVRREWTGAS